MTPIHVGELTSEVVPDTSGDGAAAVAAGVPAGDHDAAERVRELHEGLLRDAARTHAEGFDD